MARIALVVAQAVMLVGAVGRAQAPDRNLSKVREGSVLQKNRSFDEAPDNRSPAELGRDQELQRHFGRMAELDVIGSLAKGQRRESLEEQAEDVRRREVQRHDKTMLKLRADGTAGPTAKAVEPIGRERNWYKKAWDAAQKSVNAKNVSERLDAIARAVEDELRALQ